MNDSLLEAISNFSLDQDKQEMNSYDDIFDPNFNQESNLGNYLDATIKRKELNRSFSYKCPNDKK